MAPHSTLIAISEIPSKSNAFDNYDFDVEPPAAGSISANKSVNMASGVPGAAM